MHEAGIAASILDIAEREARQRQASAIAVVKIRVGEFSGVVAEALEFAFEALKPGTLAENATLMIERIPVRAWCGACQQEVQPAADLVFWCPQCNNPLTITAGQELDVEYIDVEEGSTGWNESPSISAS
jgi:hydrogenase nickel incorporation protein HypA/HybF